MPARSLRSVSRLARSWLAIQHGSSKTFHRYPHTTAKAVLALPALQGGILRGRSAKALITGITGQDGSYLAELLLAKGYEVHGIIRRASTFNTERIDHLYQDPHINDVQLFLHYSDIADSTSLIKLLYRIQPDEIYSIRSLKEKTLCAVLSA